MYDLVFTNATVIDGTGSKRFLGDVAINGSKIVAIEKANSLKGSQTIDLGGLVLTPGFIDFHSHADFSLPVNDQKELLLPFLKQGVTTFAGGNCGFSPFPVNEFSKPLVDQNSKFLLNDDFRFEWDDLSGFSNYVSKKGLLINAALLVGHGTLRAFIKGNDKNPLNDSELKEMANLIGIAKKQGAIGISLGLSYIPSIFADEKELFTIFKAAHDNDLIVTIHGHTYSWTSPFFESNEIPHNVLDIQLFSRLALETKAKVHLSHLLLKGKHTWGTIEEVLETVDSAVRQGADITFGVIPYHWGNTLIKTLLPNWFLSDYDKNVTNKNIVDKLALELEKSEKEIGRESEDLILLWGSSDKLISYEGKNFLEISNLLNLSPTETILFLMKESNGSARILTASYSGKEGENSFPLLKLMQHPRAFIEIDAIVTDTEGPQTPAAYGAFPRLLSLYTKEKALFSLEQAIHLITGKAATRLNLVERGFIKKGAIASLSLSITIGIFPLSGKIQDRQLV
jgi:N-acyl-D-amino-acid deacylase